MQAVLESVQKRMSLKWVGKVYRYIKNNDIGNMYEDLCDQLGLETFGDRMFYFGVIGTMIFYGTIVLLCSMMGFGI